MPEELYPGLYRIKIPLPNSPLKYLNSYIIKDDSKNLVIDTGLNRDVCKEAMLGGLSELGFDPDAIDIFITHLHADHFGLVRQIATEKSTIYFNRPDSELIENWQGFEPMIRYGGRNGFPEEALKEALHQHPGYKYGTGWMPEMSLINDGDILRYGGYELTCIQTPGHTEGHTCLYEKNRRFLIAGDHILYDITPNIQCWSDESDPLGDYLASLDKVSSLPVERVLPGHRNIFEDFTGRIEELKGHHMERLAEVEEILAASSPQNAYQVASKMHWDIAAKNWEAFPVAQKWFATGEAISHLRYLEKRKRIARRRETPVIEYESTEKGE
jgi:glyoxylase-like metal-dependent hydrolase (beta-lactamase superfamily II)